MTSRTSSRPTQSSALEKSLKSLQFKYSGRLSPKTSKKKPQRRIVSVQSVLQGGTVAL